MNVYILLDTSGSIKKEDFDISRNATISLIRKVCEHKKKKPDLICRSCFQWASSLFSFQLDSYEVKLKFHVLSFASEAKDIVDIRDSEISGSAENVIWNLMEFDYHSRMLLIHSHSFI